MRRSADPVECYTSRRRCTSRPFLKTIILELARTPIYYLLRKSPEIWQKDVLTYGSLINVQIVALMTNVHSGLFDREFVNNRFGKLATANPLRQACEECLSIVPWFLPSSAPSSSSEVRQVSGFCLTWFSKAA